MCAGLVAGFQRATDGDIERLLAATVRLTKLRFSKHAGQPLKDVPGDYPL
jgi:hypothetical protein